MRLLLLLALLTGSSAPAETGLISKLDELVKARASSSSDPTYAYSCKPVAVNIPLAGTRNAAWISTLPFKPDQTEYSLRDVFAMLEMAEPANSLVANFQKRYQAGDFSVEPMTSEGRLRCPIHALACYSPAKKTLYVDRGSELGELAPVLFHEILHALDDELSEAQKLQEALTAEFKKRGEAVIAKTAKRKKKSPAAVTNDDLSSGELNDLLQIRAEIEEVFQVAFFKTERQAYDGAFQAQKELVELFPDYYRKLAMKSKVKIPQNPTDDEIIKNYHLNGPVVRKYLKGLCRVATAQ